MRDLDDRSGDVTLAICEGVATVTISRVAKINALRLASWQSLRELVVAADQHALVRVIVIRGAGGHFSAGNDIASLSTFPGNPADAFDFAAAWAAAIAAVEDAAKPVIMAIEGICYGSALALSLAGDIRLASSDAMFSIPVAKLGALYLRSDLQRLAATIGAGQSHKLIYSSATLGAEQALRIGLVDEVFVNERFEQDLQHFVDTVRSRSSFSIQRSKAVLRTCREASVQRETSASLSEFAEATRCADFKEGVSAFLESRSATFR